MVSNLNIPSFGKLEAYGFILQKKKLRHHGVRHHWLKFTPWGPAPLQGSLCTLCTATASSGWGQLCDHCPPNPQGSPGGPSTVVPPSLAFTNTTSSIFQRYWFSPHQHVTQGLVEEVSLWFSQTIGLVGSFSGNNCTPTFSHVCDFNFLRVLASKHHFLQATFEREFSQSTNQPIRVHSRWSSQHSESGIVAHASFFLPWVWPSGLFSYRILPRWNISRGCP